MKGSSNYYEASCIPSTCPAVVEGPINLSKRTENENHVSYRESLSLSIDPFLDFKDLVCNKTQKRKWHRYYGTNVEEVCTYFVKRGRCNAEEVLYETRIGI